VIIANSTALNGFQPEIKQWFENQVGQPTHIQSQAWPLIQAGEHVVLTAPTGSGKTMAAFLCALDTLIADKSLLGKTRVLYISPLKALNNDIQRNLLTPLHQLKQCYSDQGKGFPSINVMTRSGDTSQSDRRRMLRHPPEILITTPESLNLLLSTQSGRLLLGDLQTVILDEIHAVITGKRGAHLITAIERLPRICGEVQRIALSATVKPLELVADFIGGYRHCGANALDDRYEKRTVRQIKANNIKHYSLQVTSTREANGENTDSQKNADQNNTDKDDFWHPLVQDCCDIIAANQSTLLFTNSRRLCEKITMKINNASGHRVAYSHHGSLSREIRSEVEQKLKDGELKAIVATNSLELGIDVGALDEVILIQSPPSISSSIQRLGRAGHGVGQVSRGRLFPTHPEDFVHAAALARAVQHQDIEAINPIRCPLDVLAQVIVSMCANETWDVDELFTQLRCSYTFYELPRHHFDLILHMLAGRYADTRIRELKPRISWDRMDNTVVSTKGAVLALYMSGGTIPNRGYYQLRDVNSNTLIGELDEEFVWEAAIGQIFTLGTQHWKVERITHNDVFVSPGVPKNSAPPFWRAESGQRDFHFSCRIGELLAYADQLLQAGNKEDELQLLNALTTEHALDDGAATSLLTYLKKQREFTGVALPHRHHIVVEHINSGPGGHAGYQLVLHTGWGGTVNRPLALALEAAWQESVGDGARLYADDNCIVVQLAQKTQASDVLSMVTPANLEALLRQRLEGSGFFAARFRECAGRALLLSKAKFNQRLPLWMSRLQAQKLHAAVDKFEDFPILLESWRSCLQDEFDLEHCHQLLTELSTGQISWSETYSATPSPFAHSVSWGQINQYMYMEDRTPDEPSTHLREDLLRDVVNSPALRPTIKVEAAKQFELKRQRLYPGYCPNTPRELLDWIKERVLLPLAQWQQLLEIVGRENNLDNEQLTEELSSRASVLTIRDGEDASTLVVAKENLSRVLVGLYDINPTDSLPSCIEIKTLSMRQPVNTELTGVEFSGNGEEDTQWVATTTLAQWLSFYAPLEVNAVAKTLMIPVARLTDLLDDLIENQTLISGVLLQDSQNQQICDADNFESLLRLQRASATPSFAALPCDQLPLFIAQRQGLLQGNGSIDDVYNAIEKLRGIALNAAQWEQSILNARIKNYDPAWLDSLMQEGEFYWAGDNKHAISFWFNDERDLFQPRAHNINQPESETDNLKSGLLSILQTQERGLEFSELLGIAKHQLGQDATSSNLVDTLWELVWAQQISNDAYSTLRTGIQSQFKLPSISEFNAPRKTRGNRPARPSRRRLADRQASIPYIGRWFCINCEQGNDYESEDLLDREENAKERARILLARYGVVCRVLVSREGDRFLWREIFRALRLMELSGEVLAGQFFSDVPGPQFISHEAFRRLQKPLPENTLYWLGATDPASLCGTAIEKLKITLPKRKSTTQLVYCGSQLILISERSGKSLQIYIEADDPRMPQCFDMFHQRLNDRNQREKHIVIETINNEKANRSVYLDALKIGFDVSVDHKQAIVHRRYSD
jgi:ATP-dependent helicase Lhr and Lhr-like helicase